MQQLLIRDAAIALSRQSNQLRQVSRALPHSPSVEGVGLAVLYDVEVLVLDCTFRVANYTATPDRITSR